MIALASAPWGGIGKEPSLPTNDKRADGVFNLVVADFNLTMLKKCAEVCLLILSISIACLGEVVSTRDY